MEMVSRLSVCLSVYLSVCLSSQFSEMCISDCVMELAKIYICHIHIFTDDIHSDYSTNSGLLHYQS